MDVLLFGDLVELPSVAILERVPGLAAALTALTPLIGSTSTSGIRNGLSQNRLSQNRGARLDYRSTCPNPENRVTLADERDANGVPVARITFSFGDNDRAIIEAERSLAERAVEAAGATRILMSDGTHHLLGTCRMGRDPVTSVVGSDCRSHDVPNLWVCDGSVFPTAGAVNPSLTIEALATRTARLALEHAR